MRLRSKPLGGAPALSYLGTPTGGFVGGAPYPSLPGKSAYQVAVDNGFIGTENEWLVSLQGGAADWNSLLNRPTTFAPSAHSHLITEVTGLTTALAGKEDKSRRNTPGGYAGLDDDTKIPAALLPSYVDDVLEFDNLASMPRPGERGKIYTALDTNKIYRWSGSDYIEIVSSPGSTDQVAEGVTNLYYTQARADARVAAGITGKADKTTTISTGPGLTGGGNLSANRTLGVDFGSTAGTVCQGNDLRLSDARTPTAAGQVADLSLVVFGKDSTRALGTGDFPFGVKLQRAVTLSAVTYRCLTANASGNLVVELRKNGTAVAGTSASIAFTQQVGGLTLTGSWPFAAGDIITVQVTSAGTTPGKGLVADIKGTTA